MALPSGTKLGPYEIQSPVGAGGMGDVYRALRSHRVARGLSMSRTKRRTINNPGKFFVAHGCSRFRGDVASGARPTDVRQTTAAFVDHHDRGQAKSGYLQVTQIDPGYAPAWFNLGVLAEADKEWVKAKSDFAEYLRLMPHGPEADRARDQSGLLDKYIQGKTDPVAVQATEHDATIQRARSLLAANLFREAIAEAGRAQSEDSSRWEAYAVVSLCMAKQHKKDEASKFRDLASAHSSVDNREKIRVALDRQIREWNQ